MSEVQLAAELERTREALNAMFWLLVTAIMIGLDLHKEPKKPDGNRHNGAQRK